jgi:MYXO-CTERM domain-containing protein
MKLARTLVASFVLAGLVGVSQPAQAFPGFFIGKGTAKRVAHSTQVVVMRKGEMSAVSVMPDFDGPLEPFAMVLVVPADVTLERVKTLKREFVDRVEQMSAPRFWEFWEMDPCEPGPSEQEWERKLTVSAETNFLGGPAATPEPGAKKVAKELFVKVDSEYKEGEYTFSMLGEGETLEGWAGGKGFTLPQGAAAAVKPYVDSGMKVILAQVDDKRIELVGGGRAQLSAIRYWSDKPIEKLPIRLGLLSSPGKQELGVYVIHPDKRYEAKNYENVYPPTNIEVDFVVKERMGEFYSAIHDMIQAKKPHAILNEYAWHTSGCGEPCPNAPILPHELLSLGADFFETAVPEEERNPKPPELTKDEKKELKVEWDLAKLSPKERKEREKLIMEERTIVLRNKGIMERNKYVVSRLHHRYDAAGLPKDLEIGPAGGHIKGGVEIPKGEKGELPTTITPTAVSKFQTRYTFFHPWKGMQKCEKPERWKWGKAPRTYRGLRKIWVAEDLSRKSRTQIKPVQVVKTAIPDLGLSGVPEIPDAGSDAGLGAENGKGSCGCSAASAGSATGLGALVIGFLGALSRRGRRRR